MTHPRMKSLRAILSLAALVTLLTACTSIPLSTIAKLSQFNRESAMAVKPDEVRMKVTVPKGFVVDPAKTNLVIVLKEEDKAEAINEKLDLRLLQSSPATKSAGMFRGDAAATEYELTLSEKGQGQLRTIQNSLKREVRRTLSLSAGVDFASKPTDAKSVIFWIDLQLSKLDGYFVLVDGARVELKDMVPAPK